MAQQIVFNNRYRILGLVGEGGMAKVYKAEDRLLERVVAVKVLREQYASDEAFVERFRQEARSAAGLAHPNIVSVYDVGVDNGANYIVMEYVEGPSLKELILQGAPFTNARAVDISLQILSALSFAHQKDIVHRDVKPQNILIAADGTVKVTDFGIARAATSAQLTETGVVLGTVHYFSPEQARGEIAAPASDIYSVGIVIYEMLTGKLPFQGDSTLGIALKHVQEQPASPSKLNPRIPQSLERIILKALAKEPSERYASAEVMKQAMAGYRQLGEQTTAPVNVGALSSTGRGKSVGVRSVSANRIGTRRRGVDWFVITLAVLILGFAVASVPVAAKVFELYFGPPSGVAPTNTPAPSPTGVPPTPSPTSVRRVGVPPIVGLAYDEAKNILETNDLQIRTVDEQPSDKVEASAVISQSVKPGTEVPAGYVVDVVISKGPERVAVPGVIGDVLNVAESKINALGLKVDVKEDHDDRSVIGTVINQKPAPNTRVPRGTEVEITISLGKKPAPTPVEKKDRVTVPSLVGLPEDEARARVQAAGLTNTYPNYQGPGDIPVSELQKVPPGHVLSQQPLPGQEVKPGETVYLAIRER